MERFDKYILSTFCCGGENPEFIEEFAKKKPKLTPEEAIYLVHKCHFVPIEKKHDAYKVIMELYPDHVIQTNDGKPFRASDKTVTQFLSDYMADEDEWKKEIKDNTHGDYSVYAGFFRLGFDGYVVEWEDEIRPYNQCLFADPHGSYAACFEAISNRKLSNEKMIEQFGDSRLEDLVSFKIVKQMVDLYLNLTAEVSNEGKIIKLYSNAVTHSFDRLKIDLGEEYEKKELSDLG